MKNLTLAFMVAMAFASFGCKKKGGGSSGEAMAKMTEFKNEMCACKDAKCAQDVSDKMTKWSQEQSKNQKDSKPTEEDTKKFAAISEEMGQCMQTAMGGGDMAGSAEAGSAEAGSAEGEAAGSADGSAAPAAEGSADGSAAPAAEGSAAAPAEGEAK